MSTIPASQLVAVNPSVLSAGGTAIDINALMITQNPRFPVGSVLSFPSSSAVAAYAGATSPEATETGIYFGGFTNANKLPGQVLIVQYPATAVAAYLRGGSIAGLSLIQLQALSGSLSIAVDGYTRSVANISLAAASSFSAAAALIQAALSDPVEATCLGSISAQVATFTGSISGNVLTVTAVGGGTLVTGGLLTGSGVAASTNITGQLSGAPGGTGTYAVSVAQGVPSTALQETYGLLTVTTLETGTLSVGQTLAGTGVSAGTVIEALGSGLGGTGTYYLNLTQTFLPGSLTASATPITVAYDSVSGGLTFTSGVPGAASSVAFATGGLATPLNLTSATGAVISQGSAPLTPAAFLTGVLAITQNWVTYMTLFDPDGGVGNANKQAFAEWKNPLNNRFGYVCWDTDIVPTETVPDPASLGQILQANQDSGTCLIWEPSNQHMAAFICGAAASIDFTQTAGRITFAYKWQAGLTAGVTNGTVAQNLLANGYNFGGAYGSANTNFVNFQNGAVTGQYKWFDSYINQIWLSNLFQNALLTFLSNVYSVPYNSAGNAMIEAALGDSIQAGLNFGAFSAGVALSAAQIAEVNAQAGMNIATTLQSQGYYLLILPSSPATRAARSSPPMTFYYCDAGSVQVLNLSSVELQ